MNKKVLLIAITALVVLGISTIAMAGLLDWITGSKKSTKTNNDIKVSDITTGRLLSILGKNEVILVDIRDMNAYNGWRLKGEARGGHIAGAVDFPLSWLKLMERKDVLKTLKSKGVSQNKRVVVYGYNKENSIQMAKYLKRIGYKNVLAYKSGIMEWSDTNTLPMQRLENYKKLVHPAWVKELISSDNSKDFKIVEVNNHWTKEHEYNKEHIPGALLIGDKFLEDETTENFRSDDYLVKELLSRGITSDTMVVLYGDKRMATSRVALVLMYLGVKDVRLLNGGYQAWKTAEYKVEKEIPKVNSAKDFGVNYPVHPEYIMEKKEIKGLLADEDGVSVSVRSWPEYIGKTSGYSFIDEKGRIASSVWGHAGTDPYHMEHFKNVDLTMRNYHEIAEMWEKMGITPNKRVEFHCGTGWRASETWFAAYLMGWDKISMYDGGWFEWIKDDSAPIIRGFERH
ncbi:MAG: hypothetical protein K9K39_07415 [Desulfohalobiaceae bacterium]|nr:hypothetical protein [Desulfohalobiaceae bacterium]